MSTTNQNFHCPPSGSASAVLDQAKWMYMCGKKDWKEFDTALQAQLEARYSSGGNKFSYTLGNELYDADFMKWKQVKRSDPTKVRNIKREIVSGQNNAIFKAKNSLRWLNLTEIMNYEVTFAFHHVLKSFLCLLVFIIVWSFI
ncbi:uncharacterized protein LOC132194834 [Neocloeon triangulifer]|uniref:uncharacterized protein LOC132194834 n=1 Tax=Neocloeon triangulifer TaxID=2078957 RepID=UPI00286F6324|nr:uncharacterized protein LOC132194834 [Neocloeon triangulifer]